MGPRICLLLSLVPLVACASNAPHAASTRELVGTWQLAAGSAAGARIPTLTVGADGSVAGNGGVNRFRGSVDVTALDRGVWRASGLSSSRMAGTAEAMALEQQYFDALAGADRAVVAGNELHLLIGDELLVVLHRSTFGW